MTKKTEETPDKKLYRKEPVPKLSERPAPIAGKVEKAEPTTTNKSEGKGKKGKNNAKATFAEFKNVNDGMKWQAKAKQPVKETALVVEPEVEGAIEPVKEMTPEKAEVVETPKKEQKQEVVEKETTPKPKAKAPEPEQPQKPVEAPVVEAKAAVEAALVEEAKQSQEQAPAQESEQAREVIDGTDNDDKVDLPESNYDEDQQEAQPEEKPLTATQKKNKKNRNRKNKKKAGSFK